MDNSAALASLYIAQIQVYGKTSRINMQLSLIQQFPRPRDQSGVLTVRESGWDWFCLSAPCFLAIYFPNGEE